MKNKEVKSASDLMNQIIQCGLSAQSADSECHSIWKAQGCSSLDNFQVPEPWNGDIANARLLFLSINPGYTPNEMYPRKGNPWWTDERGDWATDNIYDFFTNRFSSEHEYVQSENGRRFRIKMEDGSQKKLEGRPFWEEIDKIATLIFNRGVLIGKDYAITEIVHCKTTNAYQIGKGCYPKCLNLWLEQVLNVAQNVERIIVVGGVPRKLIARFVFPQIANPKRYKWYERSVPSGKKYSWLFIDHPAAYQCCAFSQVRALMCANTVR